MDAYKTLRERAFQKRDLAIQEARDICRRDLAAIEAVARSLYDNGPAPVVKDEPTLHKLRRAIPLDRAFSLPDLLATLERDNPGLELNDKTIRAYVSRMATEGEIRKLYKSKDGVMLWVAADAKITGGDFSAMTIADAAAAVLDERGPMTLPELVLALQDRGYRADTAPRTIMRSINGAFKRSLGRFQFGEDGRWSNER